jgi:hypothetical protein
VNNKAKIKKTDQQEQKKSQQKITQLTIYDMAEFKARGQRNG